MSAHDEALALLRERFPEPWHVAVWTFESMGRPRWSASVSIGGGEEQDQYRVRAIGRNLKTPLEAARACVAAWDEATKAERELADRLGGALERVSHGYGTVATDLGKEVGDALRAWRERRGKASGR